MKFTLTSFVMAVAITAVVSPIALHAQERVVETRIGDIETFLGVPTREATMDLYDELDYSSGLERLRLGDARSEHRGILRHVEGFL